MSQGVTESPEFTYDIGHGLPFPFTRTLSHRGRGEKKEPHQGEGNHFFVRLPEGKVRGCTSWISI